MEKINKQLRKLYSFLSFDISNKIITLICAILVVRSLDKDAYAIYTVFYMITGGINIVTSLGVPIALNAEGGKYFHNKERFSSLVAACKNQRLFFIKIFSPFIILFSLFLFNRTSVDWPHILTLLVVICSFLAVNFVVDIAESIIRLSGDYSFVPKTRCFSSTVKLALLAVMFITNTLNIYAILVISLGISMIIDLSLILKKSREFYSATATASFEDIKVINKISLNTFPEQLSAFIMPQLQLVVLSIFSNSDSIANLGALAKITLIYSFPLALFQGVFYPWLSRAPKIELLSRYLKIIMFALATGILLFVVIILLRSYILAIFGPDYRDLGSQLILLSGSCSISLFFSGLISVLNARGRVEKIWIITLSTTLTTLISMTFFDLSSLSQVLIISYVKFIPMAICSFYLISRFIRNFRSESYGPLN